MSINFWDKHLIRLIDDIFGGMAFGKHVLLSSGVHWTTLLATDRAQIVIFVEGLKSDETF